MAAEENRAAKIIGQGGEGFLRACSCDGRGNSMLSKMNHSIGTRASNKHVLVIYHGEFFCDM